MASVARSASSNIVVKSGAIGLGGFVVGSQLYVTTSRKNWAACLATGRMSTSRRVVRCGVVICWARCGVFGQITPPVFTIRRGGIDESAISCLRNLNVRPRRMIGMLERSKVLVQTLSSFAASAVVRYSLAFLLMIPMGSQLRQGLHTPFALAVLQATQLRMVRAKSSYSLA